MIRYWKKNLFNHSTQPKDFTIEIQKQLGAYLTSGGQTVSREEILCNLQDYFNRASMLQIIEQLDKEGPPGMKLSK